MSGNVIRSLGCCILQPECLNSSPDPASHSSFLPVCTLSVLCTWVPAIRVAGQDSFQDLGFDLAQPSLCGIWQWTNGRKTSPSLKLKINNKIIFKKLIIFTFNSLDLARLSPSLQIPIILNAYAFMYEFLLREYNLFMLMRHLSPLTSLLSVIEMIEKCSNN